MTGERSATLPSRADVVVIGGGVVGASVAWHLAGSGVADVLLLERNAIGSGTTWHAAGNMETWRSDPLILDLVRYAVDLFPELERQSGISFGWRQSGRVQFTADDEVMARFRAVPARGRARGIDVELLGPDDVVAKLPIVARDGLRGGLWIPSDGRVDPTNLAQAFARGAQRRGARVAEGIAVTAIRRIGDRIVGVETSAGPIDCERVVLAAGLWSGRLAETCGVRLPLIALEHFYLLTKPIAGLSRELPLFLSYDERIYGREDVGGLLVGVFDDDALPVEPEQLPGAFSFSLLPENWEQIAPQLPVVMHRFPLLQQAEIRMQVNGPESFTPDGQMLLGEWPMLRGLHLAAGMGSNGIAMSSCVGRLTAEWIVDGRPSLDVTSLDCRRFLPFQAGRTYRRARMAEVPSQMCRVGGPELDFRQTRGIRRSPLHGIWLDRGAVLGTRAGWEVPLWFGGGWAEAVAAELAGAAVSGGLADGTASAKLLLADADLEGLPGANPGPERQAFRWSFRNASGGTEAQPLAVPLPDGGWLLIGEPEEPLRMLDWLHRQAPDRPCPRPVDGGWAVLDAWGRTDAMPAVRDGEVIACEVGMAPALVIGTPVADCRRVLVGAEFAAGAAEALLAQGLVPLGALAAEQLRVLGRQPAFGHELSPAIASASTSGPAVRGFRFATARQGSVRGEPVLGRGRYAGYVTSSCWLPTDGELRLLALVHGDGPFELVVDGGQVALQDW
ncbi:MAG: FAD-dependent oxidoreductase [Geminicoccaceae bacterium]